MRKRTKLLCIAAVACVALGRPSAAQVTDTAPASQTRADSLRAVRAARSAKAKAAKVQADSLRAAQATGATTRAYGGVQTRTYGSVAAPTYGSGVKTRAYGLVPLHQNKDTTTTLHADSTPKAVSPAGVSSVRTPVQSSGVAPAAPVAAKPTPTGWTARYFYVDAQNLLHTWDFVADGTYLYREVFNGGTMSHGTSERGTYTINGDALDVHVTRITNASGSVVNRVTTMTAGETAVGQTRHYSFRMLGPNGKTGVVLNGITYKPKAW